jgi:hypothetical protein
MMNKYFVVSLSLLLLTILSLASCQSLLRGAGDLKTKDYDFTDFLHIEIDGPLEVNISYGDSYQISITANDNVFEKIKVTNGDNILKLTLQNERYFGLFRTQYVDTIAQVEIRMPNLRNLSVSGKANVTCSDFSSRASAHFDIAGASSLEMRSISTGNVKLNVSSASKVNGEITAGDVEIGENGASTIRLTGSANIIVCESEDASQLNFNDFMVDTADVRLSGNSIGTVNVIGKLHLNLDGGSTLTYIGDPILGSVRISGDSTMHRELLETSTLIPTSVTTTPSMVATGRSYWQLIGWISGGIVLIVIVVFLYSRRRD